MNSSTDHPLQEQLADYVVGRLDDVAAARVDAHLEGCAECAADFHFTRSLRARAVEQGTAPGIVGSVHLLARRIAQLSDRGVSPTRLEQEHLDTCTDCAGEIEALAAVPPPGDVFDAVAVDRPVATRRPSRLFSRWSFGILATAAAVVFFVGPWHGSDLDLADLAVVEPMPVRVPRGGPDEGAFESARRAGLLAYSQGNFATAATQLRIAFRHDPTDEIRLYLGSALFLDDDPEGAATMLRAAIHSADTLMAEEARWQLANVYLKLNRRDDAVPLLRELADAGAGHAPQAQSILDALP